MKLKEVRVREFRSIWDSNPFKIDRVACLVGKNEAGKTAILQALYRLNPIVESDGNFDVTDDYPRAEVENYQHDIESKSGTTLMLFPQLSFWTAMKSLSSKKNMGRMS